MTDDEATGHSLYDKAIAALAATLPAVLVAVFLEALLPGGTGLFGGFVAWYLVTRRLLSGRRRPGEDERRPRDRETDATVRRAGRELDALVADVPGNALPVARGIHDRATRYLDHEAFGRARETAERARRVAGTEAVVRSVLADAESVRQQVAGVRRMEELLRDAEDVAGTDPGRAEELVDDADRIADRLVTELREEAEDRAEDARRAGARGDDARAARRWSEAYEVATAALELGLDGPGTDDAASREPDRRDPAAARSPVTDRDAAVGSPAPEGTAPTDQVPPGERDPGTSPDDPGSRAASGDPESPPTADDRESGPAPADSDRGAGDRRAWDPERDREPERES